MYRVFIDQNAQDRKKKKYPDMVVKFLIHYNPMLSLTALLFLFEASEFKSDFTINTPLHFCGFTDKFLFIEFEMVAIYKILAHQGNFQVA